LFQGFQIYDGPVADFPQISKHENACFVLSINYFLVFGNERTVFHRHCSPAIRFIPIEEIGMLAAVGFS